MDVQQTTGFLSRMQGALAKGNEATGKDSAADVFQQLLKSTSDTQRSAGDAANKLLTTGEGELHIVQTQLAKAEVTFRFLVEIRNKLTEAYQEVSRLSV